MKPFETTDVLKQLRTSYRLALGILGILVVLFQFLLHWSHSVRTQDSRLLNLAGRQRMLSQKIAKLALLPQQRHAEIQPLLAELLKTHEGLQNGSADLGLRPWESESAERHFQSLNPVVAQMEEAARAVSQGPNPQAKRAYLVLESRFLSDMDSLVGVYEVEARERIVILSQIQWVLVALFFVVLFLESKFIFLPLQANLKVALEQREEAQHQAQKALQEAENAARLKSEFLANMSHEIRTPMNGILGMTELMIASEMTKENAQYAKIVQSSAESLLQILNDILDVSKIEAGEFRLEALPFDLLTEVEEIVELQSVVAVRKGVELILDIEPSVPKKVKGDPLRLRQVLLNLVANALKFTDEGYVFVKVESQKALVRFSVTDSGPGIPEDKHEALFRAFEQLDGGSTRRQHGTGLGLTIARSLVELMGGEIGLESQPGVGSTFWFEIPLETLEERPFPEPSLAGKRVLVVDDLEVNRHLLQQWLKRWGAVPDLAEDGLIALEKMESHQYDFVLVDYEMPIMDGLAFAHEVQKRKIQTPLIALPSVGDIQAENFERAGFLGFVRKPLRERLLRLLLGSLSDDQTIFVSPDRVVRNPALVAVGHRFQGRVLVVDDNETNRAVAGRLLMRLGLEVDFAVNGREAVDKTVEDSPDLVLMDCQMPVMDGYQATTRLRSLGITTPIVALTANAMSHDRQVCLESGMDEYLSKPIRTQQMRAVLAKFLDPIENTERTAW